jgi:hypothetical protein
MKVEEAKYSIAELVEWFQSRVLVVNNEYQRAGSLWPPAAKSYFIDTILKEFPFPKVYFHERLDRDRRPRREIVDGQQRITTLVDFADGKFALGRNARGFEGNRFNDLTEEQQVAFYSYTVSVDVIRNAERADILEMFRRMNAYTLPLNAAEKRHSEFFGEFKDWVNIVLDQHGAMLVDWNILTSRQVVRRADAELISDLALAIEEGIVSTSPAKLLSLYRKYDKTFPSAEFMLEMLLGLRRDISNSSFTLEFEDELSGCAHPVTIEQSAAVEEGYTMQATATLLPSVPWLAGMRSSCWP